MVELWIIIVILCLLIATGSTLLALRLQNRSLDKVRQEREAWQQAQEGRQRTWEVRQGKHILDAEKKLADQVKEARGEWRDWDAQLQQKHQEWREDVDFEKELKRLPHIEELELAHGTAHRRLQPKGWQPAMLFKADLQERDLSYRYMERADLREAQLSKANLYMADLTGACLNGANLPQANLISANLSGADLRGADLSGANLLVADLHNTVLHGANLTGVSNLTPEQLQTAIYDSTTLIDSSVDITLPRIRSVRTTPAKLLTAAPAVSEPTTANTSELALSTQSLSSSEFCLSEANETPASTELPLSTQNVSESTLSEATEIPASAELVLSTQSVSDSDPAQSEANETLANAELAHSAQSVSDSDPVQLEANETPDNSYAREDAGIPLLRATASIDEFAPITDNSDISVSIAIDAPMELTTVEEGNFNSPSLVGESSEQLVESTKIATSETNQKSNSARKRSSKAKQTIPVSSEQTFVNKQEESAEQADESQLPLIDQEEADAGELPSSKIIQWQARTIKTRPLAGAGEQNKDDQLAKKRGNNRPTGFPTPANDDAGQQAQAN
ncbi:MAG TPA: pentapeptide repeat-containing protein [Ktedonobacteraceae bacterium]